MDKKSRRNSILKPSLNQETFVEYEEEQTENFTFSRRKSMKRVSFAGRDEVKEFQKHEALTVEKLEKALSKIQNDSAVVPMEFSIQMEPNTNNNSETDKENIRLDVAEPNSLPYVEHPRDDDMDITSTAIINPINIEHELQKIIVHPVEMDLSANSLHEAEVHTNGNVPDLNQTAPCSEHFADVSKEMEISTQETETIEMNGTELSSAPAIEFQIFTNETTTTTNKELDQDIKFVPRNDNSSVSSSRVHFHISETVTTCVTTKEMEITVNEPATACNGNVKTLPIESMADLTPVNDTPKASISNYYNESSEFCRVSKLYNWRVLPDEKELFMLKLCNCFTLKLLLSNEYLHHGSRHFVVEEIEVDTKKEVPNKWARFGLTILENTVDNFNLKSICSSTEDLVKLLHLVQEPVDIFQQFMFEDSSKFELLTNPRSLKVDIENMKLSFELSNLENLLMIQVTLTLNPIFPLSAKDVTIHNLIGKANKTELSNMISTIRPCGQYLTRVAECIEDYLKFPTIKSNNGVFR